MSLAVAVNWASCALIGAGFLKFIEYVQLYGAFFFFTGWSLIGLWFVFHFIEEDRKVRYELQANLDEDHIAEDSNKINSQLIKNHH